MKLVSKACSRADTSKLGVYFFTDSTDEEQYIDFLYIVKLISSFKSQVCGPAVCTRKYHLYFSKYDKRKCFIILVYKCRCNVRDVCAEPQSISF